jgi:hypothetical protein
LQISQTDVKKKMDKVLGRNQNLEEEWKKTPFLLLKKGV